MRQWSDTAKKLVSKHKQHPDSQRIRMLFRLSKNVPSYKSATHQSLPCVKGGGKNRRFLTEELTVGSDLRYISQPICAGQSLSQPSADSSLYTREPWALPRQCEKRDFFDTLNSIRIPNESGCCFSCLGYRSSEFLSNRHVRVIFTYTPNCRCLQAAAARKCRVYLGRSSQKATALAAATFRESTWWDMGILTV